MALGGNEVARMWATIGADISPYMQALDLSEQRARLAAQNIQSALGNIQVAAPSGYAQHGGLLLPTKVVNDLRAAEEAQAANVQQAERLGGALGQVGKMFGLSFGAFTLRQVMMMAGHMAELGAQAERVEMGFRGLAGAGADEMLEELRRASRGAISDTNLMLSANRAMLLGVTQSADEMVRLMEVARVRGAAMGLSTQQAFQDIVTGIGRMSPLILDNLGILTGGERAMEAYARSIGKTSQELTDAERRQFLLNKVLSDSQTQLMAQTQTMETAATQLERMSSGWENFQAAYGKMLAAQAAPAAGGLGTFLSNAAQGVNDVIQLRQALTDYTRQIEAANRTGAISQQTYAALKRELDGLRMAYAQHGLTLDQFERAQARIIEQYPELSQALDVITRGLANQALMAEVARDKWAELRNEMIKTNRAKARGPVMTEDMIQAQWEYNFAVADTTTQIKMLEDRLAAMPPLQELIAKGDEKAVREYYQLSTQLHNLRESAAEDAKRQGEKAAREWQSEVERQQRELRSLVEGILQPTQVTELDMARTRLGLYQGQWDEYIRRLRSAASDAQSQWRYLIPTDILQQGADAIKVWVAETEEAFYAGQLPEMIDWDAFDRALQDQIAKQQAREALIQTAMSRAAGRASKEQVIAALGLPITPSEAISMDLSGIGSQVQLGKPITDAFERQLQAESERWKQLGMMAMEWFSAGALSGVNPQVGAEIARKLWPYFSALLPEERP